MDTALVSALIAFAGSLIGTFAGIITSSKLTEYRLKELERKVEKHNSLVDRMYLLEDRMNLNDERVRSADSRLKALEEERNEGKN